MGWHRSTPTAQSAAAEWGIFRQGFVNHSRAKVAITCEQPAAQAMGEADRLNIPDSSDIMVPAESVVAQVVSTGATSSCCG